MGHRRGRTLTVFGIVMNRSTAFPGIALALSALFSAGILLAQHSFTPEEVGDGGRLYGSNCASCHGPKGDAASGVELMTGKFRRATSDDDLVKLVRNGIPNTAMQPQRDMSDMQAATIIAYLRSMAITSGTASAAIAVPALPPGDAVRGKALFEGAKGNCQSCHRVGGNGSRFGPDLSAIGAPPRGGGGRGGAPAPASGPNPQTLVQKLLEPNATMTAANRYVRLIEKNGNVVAGKLLNEDTFAIQVFDSKEKLSTFQKANLKDYSFVSPMPSYRDKLNPQELSDVTTYLISLKGN
jgi:mono/diheme cytochrome c family protein